MHRDPIAEKGHRLSLRHIRGGHTRTRFYSADLKDYIAISEGVGGWHLYAFLLNNSLTLIDPLGKQPVNDVCCVTANIPTTKCTCIYQQWQHKPSTPCTSSNHGAVEVVEFDAGCSAPGKPKCIRDLCRLNGCKVRITWYCSFIIEDDDGNVIDDPGLNWHGGATIVKDCGYVL